MVRLINLAPGAVMVGLDSMVELLEKCLQRNLKMIAGNQEVERASNNCRQATRVVEALASTTDVEMSNKFSDFLNNTVLNNPMLKEMFDNIASIRKSKAVEY